MTIAIVPTATDGCSIVIWTYHGGSRFEEGLPEPGLLEVCWDALLLDELHSKDSKSWKFEPFSTYVPCSMTVTFDMLAVPGVGGYRLSGKRNSLPVNG